VALVYEEQQISYEELNARANQLARHLRRRGVKPEGRVAICAQRGVEMVVSLLAVLKAGAGYVPLDPAYPGERLGHMLADSAPEALLCDQAGRAALGEQLQQLQQKLQPNTAVIDLSETGQWRDEPRGELQRSETGVRSHHLAYVIYTSGSTGTPKGAMNEHKGVVNRLRWMQGAYGLTASDAVLQKTPFSFDVSVWEFFWPLMAGARLIVARPEGHKSPEYLGQVIQSQGVTTVHFVPSMLQAFLESGQAGACASLERVMSSGEALPGSLVQRFEQQLPRAQLNNLYGPTEAAVDVTAWNCQEHKQEAGQEPIPSIPIGRPIANTQIHILDPQGEPAPLGVTGELYIGGIQVGRGYLNRPDLTAERFVADPFGRQAGARLYRTGDLGRWRSDGTIEYLGRNDDQVKIRGFRIELGEIQARLSEQPGIREAVVLARDSGGDKRLVAYYSGQEQDIQQLRARLTGVLPEYMVPAAYVKLEQFPLTPNGKLDRKALPDPGVQAYAGRGYEAPRGEVEETLARIWAQLLKVERVGRNDNFFELGGHSLLVITLVERINLDFDVQVTLSDIFLNALLYQLAGKIINIQLEQFSSDELSVLAESIIDSRESV
jgi:amino acid adenylation domain-containing protein